MTDSLLPSIIEDLKSLTEDQLSVIRGVITSLRLPIVSSRLPSSDIVSDLFLYEFGAALKIHHYLSDGPLSKFIFERMMVKIARRCGHNAHAANPGNPGHDITIDEIRFSLKTEGNAITKPDDLYISKYMELGRGKWVDEEDLKGLRDQFLRHLLRYERILSLRFGQGKSTNPMRWFYELVEIPKSLLEQSAYGEIEMRHNSTQSPKPGYCVVKDQNGNILYALYFDGGGERKLQIKGLKKQFCTVHARWSFSIDI